MKEMKSKEDVLESVYLSKSSPMEFDHDKREWKRVALLAMKEHEDQVRQEIIDKIDGKIGEIDNKIKRNDGRLNILIQECATKQAISNLRIFAQELGAQKQILQQLKSDITKE